MCIRDRRKKAMAERIIAACCGSIGGKTLAVLGVTFKPNTDDMRESPSLDILPALQKAGGQICAYDPEGMTEAGPLLPGVNWCQSAYETMVDAEAVVIITEWNEFRLLDLERIKSLLRHPLMIDLRNIYDPSEMASAGFVYHSIGRPEDTNYMTTDAGVAI